MNQTNGSPLRSNRSASDPENLVPVVLKAITAAELHPIPAGTQLFHGCTDKDNRIDTSNNFLFGDRKWLSQDAYTALDYAYDKEGKPYFWVCTLNVPAIGLILDQQALISALPPELQYDGQRWLPNNFARHARSVFGQNTFPVMLNQFQDGCMNEVLVPAPREALTVIRLYELPHSKEKAKAMLAQPNFLG